MLAITIVTAFTGTVIGLQFVAPPSAGVKWARKSGYQRVWPNIDKHLCRRHLIRHRFYP